MRITLLRSPTMPDPSADFGEHSFTYSLFPHSGSWDERTQAEAYALNDPILVYRPEKPAASHKAVLTSLAAVSSPNVVVETIKRAEDGDGIVLRLYESHRSRGPVAVSLPFSVAAAWETNLLEENQQPLDVDGNRVLFTLKPFQIMTIRVTPV
jgi:alpha-mannosidase